MKCSSKHGKPRGMLVDYVGSSLGFLPTSPNCTTLIRVLGSSSDDIVHKYKDSCT